MKEPFWIQNLIIETIIKISHPMFWNSLIPYLKNFKYPIFKPVSELIKVLIDAQSYHLKYFPNIYCKSCFSRVKKYFLRVSLFRKKYYVACPICGKADSLINDVKHLIGIIWGEVKDYKIDEDTFYVNLWLEDEKSQEMLILIFL